MQTTAPIYFDHMASTPVDSRVARAMAPYWSESYGNPHSVDHSFGWGAHEAIENAAIAVARLIGADPDEIIFTSGATEANNLAILGIAHHAPAGRRRILVSAIEHTCALAAARAATARYGMICETIPIDTLGRIDLSRFADMMAKDVLCVVTMAVNNEIGTIQDMTAIGALCAEQGAVLICDAVQAPMARDIDVARNGIGLLSLSSHKIYGPKGVGALYIRRDLQTLVEPQIYGGNQQKGLRSGTLPTPLCVGFAMAAALLTSDEASAERTRIGALRNMFETKIENLGWPVIFNGAKVDRHPGNSNIQFVGRDGRHVLAMLQPRVAASSGSACASGTLEPSHVLRAIGLSAEEADASVRFSLGRFTTEDDVLRAISEIDQVLAEDDDATLTSKRD